MSSFSVQVKKRPMYKVQVAKTGGLIQNIAPLTLKNTIAQSDSLENLRDVDVVNKFDGALMQYNSETNKYEIGYYTLDGGLF